MPGHWRAPAYLPAPGRALLPWLRATCEKVAARNPCVDRSDLWDEAITAVIRACVYYRERPPDDGAAVGTFLNYAKTAVTRGLWRYAIPNTKSRHNRSRLGMGSLNELAAALDGDDLETGVTRAVRATLVTLGPEEALLAWEAMEQRGIDGRRDGDPRLHQGLQGDSRQRDRPQSQRHRDRQRGQGLGHAVGQAQEQRRRG